MDFDKKELDFYMGLAIDKAWEYQCLTYPNPPVGAVILDKNGKILSIEAHKRAGHAHAELEAIASAYKKIYPDNNIQNIKNPNELYSYIIQNHKNIFKDASIFVTLEPCNHHGKTPPCSILLKELGFKNVIIGTPDINKDAAGGYEFLKKSGIDIKIGILKESCRDLLWPFVRWREEKFVLFKMAQRLNGSIDGGYISHQASLNFVHKIRDRVDTILVGGATVRSDSPTLDARFVNGKAPNVKIYSQKCDFDRSAPLFKVPNRDTTIVDNIHFENSENFILIEGGGNMIEATKDISDMFLFIVSPNMQKGLSPDISVDFRVVHTGTIEEDIFLWMVKK